MSTIQSDEVRPVSCLKMSLFDVREQILNRVEQMRSATIQLRIFLLPSAGESPSDAFWKTANERAALSENLDDFDEDVMQRLENLFDVVRKKIQQKRALTSLTMTIIQDLQCGVNVTTKPNALQFYLAGLFIGSTSNKRQGHKNGCTNKRAIGCFHCLYLRRYGQDRFRCFPF